MSVIECENLGVCFKKVKRKPSTAKRAALDVLTRILARAMGLRSRGDAGDDLFWALKDVSFSVDEGTSVGFVGRNGAGKSTLFRVIAGVYRPNQGRVRVQGKVSALLSLGAGLNNELSGEENILLYGVLLGMPADRVREMVPEIIDFAELHEFIHQPLKHYSTGMRSRLAFAVASAVNPEILLLDEVLAVGDAGFRNKCERRLKDMIKGAKALLIVSHGTDTILRSCERAIWIDKGRVMYDGPASETVKEYKSFLEKTGGG